MVAPPLALVKASMASSSYGFWSVEPLPWSVPDTLTALVVAPPPPAAVVVALPPLPELSEPQAAPTRARARTAARAAPHRLVIFTRGLLLVRETTAQAKESR